MHAVLIAALVTTDAAPMSTFRVGRASCQHCDIAAAARNDAGDGAIDCGWAKETSRCAVVSACARRAWAAEKSFFALTSTNGIDYGLVIAVIGRGKQLHKLEYLDDVTGGMGVCEGATSGIAAHRSR